MKETGRNSRFIGEKIVLIENGIQRSNKEHVASGPKISKSILIKEMETMTCDFDLGFRFFIEIKI